MSVLKLSPIYVQKILSFLKYIRSTSFSHSHQMGSCQSFFVLNDIVSNTLENIYENSRKLLFFYFLRKKLEMK